ncbi:MAG: translation initiation factor IF-2 [Sandaracinaceae bacterium]|nr:translation initiation factor IF-2 [Sandaracinaceae bacterium]
MQGGAGGGPRGRGMGAGPATMRRPGAAPSTVEMSAHKKVIKIEEKITLAQLAGRMSLKATDVLMKLMQMGMSGVNINSSLDSDTAKILASEFGWEVSDVAVSDEQAIKELRGEEAAVDDALVTRPPVVTVMGHVDHGKTSLLDYIRKATVAAGEAGGITQHIGAYRVKTSKGEVAFLDTPGHEAFTAMRARGAQVTDIVILVVAADDGVMPQTREAVNHAKAAKVPIVVAVNKIDKPDADPARPRRELMELGLVPEDLGGDTMFFDVSAKTGKGIDELLEGLSLQAEVLELKANPDKPANGTVIEAMLDRGKGPVARILVRDGTLSVGDIILAGPAFGKVRAMTDELGRAVQKAGPATPVEVLGLSDVPNAGDTVDVVKDARKAQEFADARKAKEKRSIMPATAKVTLEQIAAQAAQSGQLELRLIVKADVQGSVEAVSDALAKLTGEKVRVSIVHSAVGAITEGDVNLATASKAIIIGFNVRPAGKASSLADTEGVQIRLYNIIYNAVDDVKKAMEGLLAPTIVEKFLGRAEVRQVFNITKVGTVAGCMVVDGTMKRAAGKVRLIRDAAQVWEGKISGLKHIKEDKREVEKGFECGISLEGYNDVKPGDFIECYDVEEVAAKL